MAVERQGAHEDIVDADAHVQLQPPSPPFATAGDGESNTNNNVNTSNPGANNTISLSASARTSFTRLDHDADDAQPHLTTLSRNDDSSATQPRPPTAEFDSEGPSPPGAPSLTSAPTAIVASPNGGSGGDTFLTTTTAQLDSIIALPTPQTPVVFITFLLLSARRRTMTFEPATTIGRVKDLVWNSWPGDWQDERPPAPSYLRVLYLGRMLQDDETLTNLKLPTFIPPPPPPVAQTQSSGSSNSSPSPPGPTPTIMHLSIRPYAPPGEAEAIKKKRKRGQTDDVTMANAGTPEADRTAGCCSSCVIC